MKRNLAVFFSGRVLDYEINNEWIQLFKIHFGNLFNIDYFCSINSKLDDYHKKFLKIYNIQAKCYNFEKYVLDKTLQNKNVNPNMFSMFYNNKKCVELIENSSTQYDVILRYRTEVCYQIPFKIPDVIKPNTVYIPNNYDWGGINDQIAYGDLESMKTYTELYDNINNYNRKYNITIHPETLLKYHLQKNKMNIVRFEFDYSLIKKENYTDQRKYKISDQYQYQIIEDLEKELAMYKKYNIEKDMKIDLFKLTIFNLQKQLKEKSNQINSSQTNETANYTDQDKSKITEITENINYKDKSESLLDQDESESISDQVKSESLIDQDKSQSLIDQDKSENLIDQDKSESISDQDKTESISNQDKSESISNQDKSESISNQDKYKIIEYRKKNKYS